MNTSKIISDHAPLQPTSTAAGARLPPTKDDAVNVENAVLEAVEEANDENDDNGEANAMQVEDDHQDEFPLQVNQIWVVRMKNASLHSALASL